jgi:DNA-directed RNA polymerase specialized sigma24 family protein
MAKAAKGDLEAYSMLYIKYYPVVVSFVAAFNGHNSSPEDIAQDVFTCIFEKKIFRADSTFKTYMYGIAKKILIKHFRDLHRELLCRNHI